MKSVVSIEWLGFSDCYTIEMKTKKYSCWEKTNIRNLNTKNSFISRVYFIFRT